MRMILIEEDRFLDLINSLKLCESDKRNNNTAERLGWPMSVWQEALQHARKEMHFEFVRWAQSHGASCIRR